MKDSLDKHENGHQLADYRIKETQVTLLHITMVYTLAGYSSMLLLYCNSIQPFLEGSGVSWMNTVELWRASEKRIRTA